MSADHDHSNCGHDHGTSGGHGHAHGPSGGAGADHKSIQERMAQLPGPEEFARLSPAERAEVERKLDALLEEERQMQEQERKQEEEHERKEFERRAAFRETVSKNYKPVHPEVFDFKQWKFEEKFEQAFRGSAPPSTEAIRSLVTEVSPGIYTFDMMRPDFCKLLTDELENFEKWAAESKVHLQRPNSMNRYGGILDDYGFDPCLQELTKQIMEPMTRIFFPWLLSGKWDAATTTTSTASGTESKETATLDSHHGFAVDYQIGKDTKLDFHVDDSESTLNLCLGYDGFEGGTLFFGGVRCPNHTQTATRPGEEFELGHKIGRGIIHVGSHRHAAKPLLKGKRTNLILWCRSSAFRAARAQAAREADARDEDLPCPAWCGAHNKQAGASV